MPQGPNGLRARAPTIVPSFSKEERAELPDERCSSTQTGGRGRPGGGLGQVPSALGLGWPCEALGFPERLPHDPLCPWWHYLWSKAVFPETVPLRRRARAAPGLK